ncbi:MAG: hypothetical protein ISR96_12055 [Nitrospira sp.]|nr:hypothetical protein [Nitrospira sp.]
MNIKDYKNVLNSDIAKLRLLISRDWSKKYFSILTMDDRFQGSVYRR